MDKKCRPLHPTIATILMLLICAESIGLAAANSIDDSASFRIEYLKQFQSACDVKAGYTTFKSQVNCFDFFFKMDKTLSSSDSGQLFLLDNQRLAYAVEQKLMTDSAAQRQLHKAYFDFLEREIRSNANASAERTNETRLAAERQKDEMERRRAATDAAIMAANAARQSAQAQADARRVAAVQQCVTIAHERLDALAASSNASVRANHNAQSGLMSAFGQTPERACESNPDWYRTIAVAPPPQQRSHCESDQLGGYDCTSQ